MDAIKHLDEALCLLTGEVYRVDMLGNETKMEGMCTIVLDLQRIDSAIGPKGESIFGKIADNIQAAYVEITAARAALATVSASSEEIDWKQVTGFHSASAPTHRDEIIEECAKVAEAVGEQEGWLEPDGEPYVIAGLIRALKDSN